MILDDRPHLLHIELRYGEITLSVDCPYEEYGADRPCATWEDGGPVDECWPATQAMLAIDEDSEPLPALYELGDHGRITGPIAVHIWNNGDRDECYPIIDPWLTPWWLASRRGKVAHRRNGDGNAACGRVVFHRDATPAPAGTTCCKRCVAALQATP